MKSIESIVSNISPQVLTLNEINLRQNKKLNIKGFKCFNKNRVNGVMGGVATCVAESDDVTTLKVSEGKDDNEFLITRHSQFRNPINIINVYGDVESRNPKEVIDTKWDEILAEIVKIEARFEEILIIGDMNKHLSNLIDKENTKYGKSVYQS